MNDSDGLAGETRCYYSAWIIMWFQGFFFVVVLLQVFFFFWVVSFIKHHIHKQFFSSAACGHAGVLCWDELLVGFIFSFFCRSRGSSRGSGGGGTCRGTWAPTPNISPRRSAAATTSTPRSPCWRGAAPKRAGARPPAPTTCPAYESDGRQPKVWNSDLQNITRRRRKRTQVGKKRGKKALVHLHTSLLEDDIITAFTLHAGGHTLEELFLLQDLAHVYRWIPAPLLLRRSMLIMLRCSVLMGLGELSKCENVPSDPLSGAIHALIKNHSEGFSAAPKRARRPIKEMELTWKSIILCRRWSTFAARKRRRNTFKDCKSIFEIKPKTEHAMPFSALSLLWATGLKVIAPFFFPFFLKQSPGFFNLHHSRVACFMRSGFNTRQPFKYTAQTK